MLILTMQSCAA